MLKGCVLHSPIPHWLSIILLLLSFHAFAAAEITDLETHLEMARVLTNLKQYDEAIKEYENILKAQPENVQARIELAKIFSYLDHDDQVLIELSKIPPEHTTDELEIFMAEIYLKSKKYAEAEKIYVKYLEKKPNDDGIRLKLAEMLSWQKRYQDSIREFSIVLNHRPEDIQVRRKYAQVLTWMGNNEKAIEEWKKTLP